MDLSKNRWRKSQEMLARARQCLPAGVSSPFRAKVPQPLYFQKGQGARLQDVDGNWYVDYTLGWGPNILGYRHPALVEAIRRVADHAHTYGAQHELEYLVAEQIQRIVPCAELVGFTSSGTEAVQIAWRLVRAHTGRPMILKFEGHYHGWMDSVLLSYHPMAEQVGPREHPCVVPGSKGQISNAAENVLVLPWNDAALLEQLFAERGHEIAAVAMEPVLCNSGCLLPRSGFLQTARDVCDRHHALLHFDEIITGFRMALGGAQQYYDVTPDIATFGKALAGGLTLSALAGRREIVEQMVTGGVAFGGSFNGNPVSLAGANAALQELARGSGAALAHANRAGLRLMKEIGQMAARRSVPLQITGFGAAFCLHFTERATLDDYRDTLDDDQPKLERLIWALLAEGVLILPDGRMYVSAVHTDEDLDRTLAAFEIALGGLA